MSKHFARARIFDVVRDLVVRGEVVVSGTIPLPSQPTASFTENCAIKELKKLALTVCQVRNNSNQIPTCPDPTKSILTLRLKFVTSNGFTF